MTHRSLSMGLACALIVAPKSYAASPLLGEAFDSRAPVHLLDETEPLPLRVNYTTSSSVTSGELILDGVLHRRVVGELNGNTVMTVRLAQSMVEGQERDDVYQRAFVEAPFLVHYDSRGAVVEAEFAKPVPRHIREALHRLMTSLEVVVPPERVDTWVTTSHAPRREVAVRYTLASAKAGTVRLQRQLVEQRKTDNRPGHAVEYVVLSSAGEVEWNTRGVASVTADDLVEVRYKGGSAGQERTMVHARADVGSGGLDLPATLEDAYEAVQGNDAQRLRFYRLSPDELLTVKGLSFEAAIQAYMAKVDETPSEAVALLKNFVRLYPEMSRSVATYLNGLTRSKDNRTRVGFAYSALAAAGHREAQRAIADVLSSRTFNSMNRDRAARSTLSLAQPERFVAAALWTYRQSLATEGLKAREDRQIVANLYGALGGWEHGERELTHEVLETLMNEYKMTGDAVRASALLPAIGNTGEFASIWPVMAPLFNHPETVVRRRAYYVFQKAAGEEAFRLFAERYEQEPELTVRLEASAIAAAMPRSRARLVWARQQLPRTNNPVILGRLVRMVGDQLRDSSENTAALRALLDTSIDDDVRRSVYRYVTPVLAKGGAK